MATLNCVTVEFTGGPLDGFEQRVTTSERDQTGFIALPINTNVVGLVSGESAEPKRPATSVAIYETASPPTQLNRQYYHYVGPASVKAFRLESWTG